MQKGYILLWTTFSAIDCERILKANAINAKLVPTPRQISSDCGLCVYFENAEKNAIEVLLNYHKFEFEIVACE